jgi:hypothetical protein
MTSLAMFLALVSAGIPAGESHCSDHEQIVFSCKIAKSSKVVSLCASRPFSKVEGNLAYRFGPVGKVELEFPSSPTDSIRQFRFAHYFRYQTDRTDVSFINGSFRYSVFDDYDEDEDPKKSRGVSVSGADGEGSETQLLCDNPVISNLKTLEDVVPCDADSALASCSPP